MTKKIVLLPLTVFLLVGGIYCYYKNDKYEKNMKEIYRSGSMDKTIRFGKQILGDRFADTTARIKCETGQQIVITVAESSDKSGWESRKDEYLNSWVASFKDVNKLESNTKKNKVDEARLTALKAKQAADSMASEAIGVALSKPFWVDTRSLAERYYRNCMGDL